MTKNFYLEQLSNHIKETETRYDNRLEDKDGQIRAYYRLTKSQPNANLYLSQCFDTKLDDERFYLKLKWQDEWTSFPLDFHSSKIITEITILLFFELNPLDELFDFVIIERGYEKLIAMKVKNPLYENV